MGVGVGDLAEVGVEPRPLRIRDAWIIVQGGGFSLLYQGDFLLDIETLCLIIEER